MAMDNGVQLDGVEARGLADGILLWAFLHGLSYESFPQRILPKLRCQEVQQMHGVQASWEIVCLGM